MYEYQALFDARGELYTRANRRCPRARAEEAAALLRHLDISPTSRWLDVCSGGGYLSERARAQGLAPAAFSCDGSLPFLRSSPPQLRASVASAELLPFPDRRFDAAACLAALHHTESPQALCAELLRVTAPGGRAAVADVAEGSAASAFLNGFVDRHTAAGHRGRFYGLEALAGFLREPGGRQIRSERVELSWRLASREEAAIFFRELFGLEETASDEEIHAALSGLGARPDLDGGLRVPWTMHYVSAQPA